MESPSLIIASVRDNLFAIQPRDVISNAEGVAFYLFASKSVGYMVSAVQPGDPSAREPVLRLPVPYATPLLVFGVAAFPVVLWLCPSFKFEAAIV